MNWVTLSSIIVSFLQWTVIIVTGANSVDLYTHSAWLDSKYKYNLQWKVDWTNRRISFNVTVATLGYVGFGIAKQLSQTGMTGADIVIGGVRSNGSVYFSDRYAIGNQLPREDPQGSQDWKLHAGYKNETHTFLSFSRPFDTCDGDYDVPITDDLSTLIWAYGEKDDELSYHRRNRGSFPVYLLDPEFKNLVKSGAHMNLSRFQMKVTYRLESYDIMHWCHFFKTPTVSKHHIVGFGVEFPEQTDSVHVPNLHLYRCQAPHESSSKTIFDSAVRSPGAQCFFPSNPSNELPTSFCQEVLFVWGTGGKDIFFPQNAGLSMSSNGTEYFMVQASYDNINRINKTLGLVVNAYYTSIIRENEIGVISLGDLSPGSTSIVIPPNSGQFLVNRYCPQECLQKTLPNHGVTIFAAFSRTNSQGRGVRILHFRGNKEMPWISNSIGFQGGYQQFRTLTQERFVTPSDQLGIGCMYDTTSRNGTIVVGGFSRRHEMCSGYLYYYSNQTPKFLSCRSQMKSDEYMSLLGIQNTTWDPFRHEVVVTRPTEYAGLTVHDYVNEHIDWDLAMRQEIQRLQLYEAQETKCSVSNNNLSEDKVSSWNPSLWGAQPYRRSNQCVKSSPPSTRKSTQKLFQRIKVKTVPQTTASPIPFTTIKSRQTKTLFWKKVASQAVGGVVLPSGFWKEPKQEPVNSIFKNRT